MRTLEQLVNRDEPGWPVVEEWISSAGVDVEVLPTRPADADAALLETQVTTRSPMGAIVHHSAGILIDRGWIRILGAGGHPRFRRSLPGWNRDRSAGFYLIADDAIGGFFALNGGSLGDQLHKIFYYAPDSLEWSLFAYDEPLGYSDFVHWSMSAIMPKYYQELRWDKWQDEVETLTGDQSIFIYPPLAFNRETTIGERHRGIVPVSEQYAVQLNLQRELDSHGL